MLEKHYPLISIIVPAYNVADYIEECLTSILLQPVQDFEIICVEDCSTDNTLSILRAVSEKDSRVVVITHDRNRGLSVARNTGIDASSGKYILYIDGDDCLISDALEKMLDAVQKNDLDLLIFCHEQFRTGDDSEIIYIPTKYRTVSVNCIMTGSELMDLQIRQGEFNPVVWTQLVRRDFLNKAGVYFLEGIRHEDEIYTPLIMEKAERAMCISDKLVMHRMHNGSIMGSGVSYRTIIGYFVGYCELMARYIAEDGQFFGLEARAKALYSSASSKFQTLSVEEQQLVEKNIPERYRFVFQRSGFFQEKKQRDIVIEMEEKKAFLAQLEKEFASLQSYTSDMQEYLHNIENSWGYKLVSRITLLLRKTRNLFRHP